MKHIHLYYDHKEDELVLAGTDNRPVGYYSTSEPHVAIKALMAETILDNDNQQEESLLKAAEKHT